MSRGTTRPPRGSSRSSGDARLPQVHHLRLLRHRSADGHLVREERHEHFGHASVHSPADRAVDPAWESRTDWDIYKGLAQAFSEICPEVLGQEAMWCWTPMQHDTAGELGAALWRDRLESATARTPVPGRTMPSVAVVARDYPNLHAQFTAIGPLLKASGNGGKGIAWNTTHEIDFLAASTARCVAERHRDSPGSKPTSMPSRRPEPGAGNQRRGRREGLEALGRMTGRNHTHLAGQGRREDRFPRHRRAAAQDHLIADLVRNREVTRSATTPAITMSTS